MEQLFRLITRLKGDVYADSLEEVLILVGENNR